MDLLTYQRTVFAFHGYDRRMRDTVRTGNRTEKASENNCGDLGFTLYATSGTSRAIDLMKNNDMAFVINTPSGTPPRGRSEAPHRRHAEPHPDHDHTA
jgi:hypothetical protein